MNSNQNKSHCLRGRHFSQTLNQNVYEKLNPKTHDVFQIIKGRFSICGRKKSQIFLK